MVEMIVRDKNNVSIIFVMIKRRNLIRIDVNNLPFHRQLVAVMAKPVKLYAVKVQHTTSTIFLQHEFYLKMILGIDFRICYNKIILAEAQYQNLIGYEPAPKVCVYRCDCTFFCYRILNYGVIDVLCRCNRYFGELCSSELKGCFCKKRPLGTRFFS